MKFSFEVPGKPVPKARPRLGRRGRVFTPQKTLDYEALVAVCARQSIPEGWSLEDSYHVTAVFYYDSNVFGDLDNTAKSILDGLNQASVWLDDKHVSRLTVERDFSAEPRAYVTVQSVPKQVHVKPKKVSRRTR